jgi:putative membrane protein
MRIVIVTAGLAGMLLALPATGRAGSNEQASAQFVKEAAAGGMAEVKMGNLAQQQAASPAVKTFGRRMVDDHSKANDELKGLAAKKNITLPADVEAKDKATYDRLSKLQGAEFDRAYIDAMLKDHRTDVAEFRKEAQTSTDPDVKSFATKTLPTLEQHLSTAESLASTGTRTERSSTQPPTH